VKNDNIPAPPSVWNDRCFALWEFFSKFSTEVLVRGPWLISEAHKLRTRISRILNVPKIQEYWQILKLSSLKFMKFKLSHSSPPSSNKLFIASTALNLDGLQILCCQQVVKSLTCQQFSMIVNSLSRTLLIACSFTLFPSVRIGVLICPLFPCNSSQL